MRHLRYDDITTPLMGRVLTEGEYDPLTGELVTEHTQQFVDYVPFDYTSPGGFVRMFVSVYWDMMDADVADLVETRMTTPGSAYQTTWDNGGWHRLGYYANPVHGWDRSYTAQLFGDDPRYMYPVASAYVSTDPRNWDSDLDGMDDYWELYHGLNPILGSDYTAPADGRDLIANAYGVPDVFNAYLNEWVFPWYNGVMAK